MLLQEALLWLRKMVGYWIVFFFKWMKLFVKRTCLTEREQVLLILDSHATRKDLNVILFAKQHHVHMLRMLSLPTHTIHKMQPLDRAVMQPFKAAYNEACNVWIRKYQALGLKIAQKTLSTW